MSYRLLAYLALQFLTFGAAGASAYGGFSLTELPLRFSIYAYRLLSPLAGSPGPGVSLLLSALLLSLFAIPRFRFPAALYAASALLFSLSTHVSSRFYYFPSLALILIIALGLDSSRRAVRLVATVLAVYLAVASPWINHLDGQDYARKAQLHRELYEAFESRINRLAQGDTGVVVNRLGPERLAALVHTRSGRPKLVFVRGPAMGGMIYPDDAVAWCCGTGRSNRWMPPVPGRRSKWGRASCARPTAFAWPRASSGSARKARSRAWRLR